ncbi:MAG: AMP-dependent synthetase/ligase [Desulforhopalus sp.]
MKNITDYISPDSCSTLTELLLERISRSPETTAYRFFDKITDQWRDVSWLEIGQVVNRWRSALAKENLNIGDRVALMLPNGPDWIAFEQAALSLGLIVVPLYSNDRAENIAYILENTETKVLLCPGIPYWQNLAPVINRLGCLHRIVTIDSCQPSKDDPRITCITDWLPDDAMDMEFFSPVVNETASIVYTSGTTGLPKGVMLSHRNILENSYNGLQCIDIYTGDTFLSFLPLSHMLERTAGYYLPMMAGATVAFARSIPDLGEDLLTIKPSVLIAVPRIFERIHGGIISMLAAKPKLIASLFQKAVETGWKIFLYRQGRGPWPLSKVIWPLLDRLAASKVRNKLGGRLRVIITGGAPLSTDISKFFIGLGLPLYQGYGLTETSPIISVNRIEDNRPEGVGKPLPGTEIKIDKESELLVRGSCVMQGYWRNDQATAATIDEAGWLHTGDKVTYEDGHLRITGRLKDIIVLSNGEKVAPADMEMAISTDPLFEHNLVLGEGRPFLTLLAVLNRQLWEELAGQLGVSPEPESLSTPAVREAVLERVEKHLSNFPGFVFIKDIALSLTPWTVEDGLLTPTLKAKRTVIEKQMEHEIDRMYSS